MADVTLPEQTDFAAAFVNPPEQVHRGYAGLASFPDNAVVKRADAALGFAFDSLKADNEFRITRDPQHTLAAHAAKVRDQVEQSSRERARKIDDAKAAIKAEKLRLEGELTRAANLKPNDKYTNAICGTFNVMTADQRARELDSLIKQQDGPTLAVLLEAPLVVTRLSAEQRDGAKIRLYEKASPGSFKLLQHMDKLLARFEAASVPRIDAEMKLLAGTDQFDNRIRQAATVAEKAKAGLVH